MTKPVVRLCVDQYRSNINHRQDVNDPEWRDIAEAVKSLDGGARSSMGISDSDEGVLAIGGGEPLYHVQLTVGRQSFVLTNGSADTSMTEIIIGGVDTPLQSNYLVELEKALDATHRFWLGTLTADSPEWKEV